jgi:hypothetical protein
MRAMQPVLSVGIEHAISSSHPMQLLWHHAHLHVRTLSHTAHFKSRAHCIGLSHRPANLAGVTQRPEQKCIAIVLELRRRHVQ